MTHSILLIGQSNMAGRGNPNDAPLVKNDRLFVLRNGRWQSLYRPVNPDRPFSGVCLAESFVYEYSKEHPDVNVGIIPCADGGTTLDQWAEGGVLFDNAVNNARLAQRSSQIVAVLWHQGEGDCSDNRYPLYEEKFLKIMKAFRSQLGLENVPFLLGGLGDFLPLRTAEPQYKNYAAVNKTLRKIADENPITGFVSAEGLTPNGDNLHFNAKSLLAFGVRYYEAFKQLEKNVTLTALPNDDLERTELEKL